MDVVNKLFSELELLRKLQVRNEKQHGRTKLFQYIKDITRAFDVLTQSRLLSIIERCHQNIQQNVLAKRCSDDSVASTVHSLSGVKLTVRITTRVAGRITGALRCLRAQLAKRVFAPLFSLLLALCSRIYRYNEKLRDLLAENRSKLCTQLQVMLNILVQFFL